MEHIKKTVNELTLKYETNNPFQIAKAKGIFVHFEILGDIMGYYSRLHRIQIIHINETTRAKERDFICAHELGHALLHPDSNTPFLKRHTFYSTDRIEQEANCFAKELLFADKTITSSEIINDYGVPYEVAKNF
ncbi:ImmA/IrrE family metallo-endopeptidase [Shouchella clausii]|uniref:ImmA/IrrE family metallo-endopeptidase n=1 Tax=Shouchella clausii TaxID=79880 RepID=UPI000BA5CE4E|nr:ImmA/IrrE family metallo-endopeptidase [Shouchella clausii]PAF13661.1 ImmA/IrrE family metallo-endopeptidase [Shouchella clausii]